MMGSIWEQVQITPDSLEGSCVVLMDLNMTFLQGWVMYLDPPRMGQKLYSYHGYHLIDFHQTEVIMQIP